LTDGGGLRIGTSFNSLGITQEAEISPYSSEEARQLEEDADRFLIWHKREDESGDKLTYEFVLLP
jgi:hypothetical protein